MKRRLDERGIDFVRGRLKDFGGGLAKAILSAKILEQGATSTFVGAEVKEEVLYDFQGSIRDRPGFAPSPAPGSIVPIKTTGDEFYFELANFLGSPTNIVIIEDGFRRRGDKSLRDSLCPVSYLGDEPLYLIHQLRSDELKAAFRQAPHPPFLVAIMLAAGEDLITELFAVSEIQVSELPLLVPTTVGIAVNAYDGEGHVLWEKLLET